MQWLNGFDVGGRTTVHISHLLYVDDTLIFCEADRNQVLYLNPTLLLLKLFYAEKSWIGRRTRSLTNDELLLKANLSMEFKEIERYEESEEI